jgi:hypothetical protein
MLMRNLTTNKLKRRYCGIYRIQDVRSNGLIYDLVDIKTRENDEYFIGIKEAFNSFYSIWYNTCFPDTEDNDRDVNGGVLQ